MLTYTGDDLVESVRNLIPTPDTGSLGYRDVDILRHLSEVLRAKVAPEVVKHHQEFFGCEVRIPMVAGTTKYALPKRAIGDMIGDVNLWDGVNHYSLIQTTRDKLPQFNLATSTLTGPSHYYIVGNYINTLPTDAPTSGFLEVGFFFRPSDIVLKASARQVTAVNTGTKAVTLASSIPGGWTTATTFDIHGQDSGAEIRMADQPAGTVSGTGITFTNAIDGSTFGTRAIQVGDWVCVAGEAVIPQVPRDMMLLLINATALQLAISMADQPAIAVHAAEVQGNIRAGEILLKKRVDSAKKNIIGAGGLFNTRRWNW